MKVAIDGQIIDLSSSSISNGTELEIDDTLKKSDDGALGVSKPTIFLTQEEYDTLSDEEKKSGAAYMTPQQPYLPMNDNGAVPTGAVVSFLAKRAPVGYLICDGTEYEIAKYSRLARFIENQFEAVNFFGGDGETTFAVPDMRNLFLRGHHGEAEEQLSGEIGVKQEATEIPTLIGGGSSVGAITAVYDNKSSMNYPGNPDSFPIPITGTYIIASASATGVDPSTFPYAERYTTRPVNMAILYCIKY